MCRVHMLFFFFFFFETLKCARINDTSRVIRNPNILHMRKQRRRCCNRAADQRLCFCYIDTVFPLLPKSEISASSDLLWLYSQVCDTTENRFWQKICFLMACFFFFFLYSNYFFVLLEINTFNKTMLLF